MSIDVSEEAVERLAQDVATLRANAIQWGSVPSTLRELRRQLSEKEAEVQRAVLAGVKAGIEGCREIEDWCGGDDEGWFAVNYSSIDALNPEAIAAKVKP